MMPGYREHGYDPNAYDVPGPVIRPYNWAQWLGVLIAGCGAVLVSLYALGRWGLIPQWVDDPSPSGFMLMLIGVTIVNSRRQPPVDFAPELAADRKRWSVAIVLGCAAILGAAAAIEYLGA